MAASRRLGKKEQAYVNAHEAEIDTMIDSVNAAVNDRTKGVRIWHIMVFMFRLGREFERDEG